MNLLNKDEDLVVTSVKDYAEKIHINEQNTTMKSALFVYYVTELTKVRNKINLSAIHDRIEELGCEMPSIEELDKILDNSSYFISHKGNPKAYSLSELGISRAYELVNSHINKEKDIFTLTLKELFAVIVTILSGFAFVMNISYKYGRNKP